MSIPARRAALHVLRALPGDHPGLALDRLLAEHGDAESGGKQALQDLLAAVVERGKPGAAYEAAFRRWKAAMQAREALLFTATLQSPLALGLGNASPQEIGLTLDHTYGMPLLPGSALKGLCRRVLHHRAGAAFTEEQQRILTGDSTAAGFITFWDAWMEPGNGSPFARDTITVHHPDYYASRGGKGFPTDFDDPVPNAFLAIRPGVRFHIILNAPAPEWGEIAAHLLAAGLTHMGLGGKTNAGYGRFACDLPLPSPAVTPSASSAQATASPAPMVPGALQEKIQLIRDASGTSRIDGILRDIASLPDPALRQFCAEALRQHLDRKRLWTPKNAEKPWYKAVAERLAGEK